MVQINAFMEGKSMLFSQENATMFKFTAHKFFNKRNTFDLTIIYYSKIKIWKYMENELNYINVVSKKANYAK